MTLDVQLDAATVQRLLQSSPPLSVPAESLIPAAVLVPLLQTRDGYRVLFTVRTARVEHHKGEVSFPGGARDPEDSSLEATALRETFEEVGISQGHVELLGQLDELVTRSGFHVTPFVGFIPSSYAYDPSAVEVDQVLEAPFDDLWRIYRQGPEERVYGQTETKIVAYEYNVQGHRIWGATARILSNLFDLLATTQHP